MQLIGPLSLLQHDVVIRLSNFHRFLNENTSDDQHNGETYEELVQHGKHKVDLAHVADHASGDRNEVGQSDLKHRQKGPGKGTIVSIDLHLISAPVLIQEIGLQDGCHEQRQHHLHHQQQNRGPGQRCYAAPDRGDHQVQGIVLFQNPHQSHYPAKLHQAKQPQHHGMNRQVIGSRERLQVPHCHNSKVHEIPHVLEEMVG
mmetsp:Transcript_10956/g.22830  ORF Transcript_10956/g.22830 Transcript_10956/m.22830 type:complete len:201 (-) Transcript_10956:1919-2521(-)